MGIVGRVNWPQLGTNKRSLSMKNSIVKELAEELSRLRNVNEAEIDLIDHIQLYESLNRKLEKAGLTFYDVSRYNHFAKAG